MNTRAILGLTIGLVGVLMGFLLVSIFAGPIIDNFATSGANTNLPSFSGGRAVNDLFVILYYLVSVLVILGSGFLTFSAGRSIIRGG